MLTKFILLIVIGLLTIENIKSQTVSQNDLVTTCNVLVSLVKEAGNKNPQDISSIIIYKNAYNAIRNNVTDKNKIKSCEAFFNELQKLNGSLIISQDTDNRKWLDSYRDK